MHRTYKNIQALRAIAALVVVLSHVFGVLETFWGVNIFFVISGFIISHVAGSEQPPEFAAKRIFRIVPVYWLATLGVFLVAVFAQRTLQNTVPSIPFLVKSLFFIPFEKAPGDVRPELYVGWTLNLEMFFYAIFMVSMILYRKLPELPAGVAILALVVGSALLPPQNVILKFWSQPLLLDFVLGMGIWVVAHRWPDKFKLTTAPVLVLTVFLLTAMFLIAFHYGDLLVLDLLAAALLWLAVQGEGAFAVPAWLLLAGDASYSIYLFHPYVISAFKLVITHLHGGVTTIVFATPFMLIASVLVAILSFRFIERPSNKWLRRTFLPARVAKKSQPA